VNFKKRVSYRAIPSEPHNILGRGEEGDTFCRIYIDILDKMCRLISILSVSFYLRIPFIFICADDSRWPAYRPIPSEPHSILGRGGEGNTFCRTYI